MKKLQKLTLKSISDDKLNNQEMKHIFGGTYGDSYGGCGSYDDCDPDCGQRGAICTGKCPSNEYCHWLGDPNDWDNMYCGCV
jgi:natural product precursor